MELGAIKKRKLNALFVENRSTAQNSANKLKNQIDQVFRNEVYEKFIALYQSGMLCDVILIAGVNKQRISAHRLYLAAANPYFYAMFTNDVKEKNQAEVVLEEIHGNELKALVDFCYTGIVSITAENVYVLLEAASRMEFRNIETKCAEFLHDKMDTTNCLTTWITLEPFLNLGGLADAARTITEQNFLDVIKDDDYLQLDEQHLLTLLKSDELNVWSEEQVFNALVKWVDYDVDSRASRASDLLSVIRLTQLKPKFLYDVVANFCARFRCLHVMEGVYRLKILPETELNPIVPRLSVVAKRFIAFGGSSGGNVNSEIFCPISNEWKNLSELKCERKQFCAFILNEQLYILGGLCTKSKKALISVQRYNFLSKELIEMEPMKINRYGFGATVSNNDIYVAGGVDSDSLDLNFVEKFNTVTGQWSEIAPMMEERSDCSLAFFNNRVFAIGGRCVEDSLDSVEYYDDFRNEWKFVSSMNHKRYSHAVAVHNQRLYVAGGMGEEHNENSVEFYDASIDKWTLIETLSVPRSEFGLILSANCFIIAGGNCPDGRPQNTIMKIDLDTLKQTNLPQMNSTRSAFGFVEVPNYNPN